MLEKTLEFSNLRLYSKEMLFMDGDERVGLLCL